MIKNERQLRITKSKLEDFKEYLSLLLKSKKDSKIPELTDIEENAIRWQIRELEDQIEEYESLWDSHKPIPLLENFQNVLCVPGIYLPRTMKPGTAIGTAFRQENALEPLIATTFIEERMP